MGPGYQTSRVKCIRCPCEVAVAGLNAEDIWNTRPALDKAEVERLVDAITERVFFYVWDMLKVGYVEEDIRDSIKLGITECNALMAKIAPQWQDAPDGEGEYYYMEPVKLVMGEFEGKPTLKVDCEHGTVNLDCWGSGKWRKIGGK